MLVLHRRRPRLVAGIVLLNYSWQMTATPTTWSACPSKLPPAPVSGAELAAETWAKLGELHRLQVYELISAALAQAVPDKLTCWADIERAARIGDRAVVADKEAPLVSLCFPVHQDSPGFVDID